MAKDSGEMAVMPARSVSPFETKMLRTLQRGMPESAKRGGGRIPPGDAPGHGKRAGSRAGMSGVTAFRNDPAVRGSGGPWACLN
jgi:hypothetical protein